MKMYLLAVFCALGGSLGHGLAAGQGESSAVEPPLVGRPDNFSGAVGSFQVTMRAQPTVLHAEDPLTLTVRITGTGRLDNMERPDLRRLPRFAKQFEIDDLSDRSLPQERAREFGYRLRPRQVAVKQIPPLPFVYFKPGYVPDYKGYQTTYAPAIPLKVQPRATVQASQIQGSPPAIAVPDAVLQYVEGPSVLRRTEPFALPASWLLIVMILGPPLASLLWYAGWRRRCPDASRLARRRRSRAHQEALRSLMALEKLSVNEQAQRAERILTEYLHQRLDFGILEPTPIEAAIHLQRLGLSPALVEDVARFFGACDAARFAPGYSQEQESWSTAAGSLVRALEDEPWLSRAA